MLSSSGEYAYDQNVHTGGLYFPRFSEQVFFFVFEIIYFGGFLKIKASSWESDRGQ